MSQPTTNTTLPTPTTTMNGTPLYDMKKLVQIVNRDWVLTNKSIIEMEKLVVETLTAQEAGNENIRFMDTPTGRIYLFTEQAIQPAADVLQPFYQEDSAAVSPNSQEDSAAVSPNSQEDTDAV